jgi:hypothetical protein
MFIPFAVRNTVFGDETFLKPDKLLVHSADAPNSLPEPGQREFGW